MKKAMDSPVFWNPRKFEFETKNDNQIKIKPKEKELDVVVDDSVRRFLITNTDMYAEYKKLVAEIYTKAAYYESLSNSEYEREEARLRSEFKEKMLAIAVKYAPTQPIP